MVAAARDAGLDVEVDSAGTGAYHVGQPADARMSAAAEKEGLTLTSVARQVTVDDFATFDLLVAMDRSNYRALRDLAPSPDLRDKVVLLSDYTERSGTDVPDPYYGGPDGFATVVGIMRDGAAGLARHLAGGHEGEAGRLSS